MRILDQFWQPHPRQIPYPGIAQAGNTCVFASIAGAANKIAGTSVSAEDLEDDFGRAQGGQPTFGNVIPFARRRVPQLASVNYHDRDNSLPRFGEVRKQLETGAVLILSVELAQLQGERAERQGRYHMLTMFNLAAGRVQVWDTNNRVGSIAIDDLEKLLTEDTLAIPYAPLGCLIPHDQHECLLLFRI